jgi:hypothetical protein
VPHLALRPTFEISLSDDRSSVLEKLRLSKPALAQGVQYQLYGEYGELHLPKSEHRLWSPFLSFYVAAKGNESLIHGRFAPRVEVWTPVWIAYLAMAFLAFFGLALGYSQWYLGETMWGLWGAIAGMICIAILYFIARVGQQWSSDQMHLLRDQLDHILNASNVHRTS